MRNADIAKMKDTADRELSRVINEFATESGLEKASLGVEVCEQKDEHGSTLFRSATITVRM